MAYLSRGYTPHDHRFLTGLAEAGLDVFYLRLEPAGGTEARPLPAGIRPIEWAGGRSQFRLASVPRLAHDLRRTLARLKPELVHAGPIQLGAGLVALSGFRPIVAMSWGSDLLRDATSGAGRLTARYALRRTASLLCDCQAVRAEAQRIGMAGERIIVFPWGIDLAHFRPGEDGGLRDRLGWTEKVVLLSTRSWEPIYGCLELVDGFIRAATEAPDLRLLMLGAGSLGPRIRAHLQAARMLNRVHFPGQVAYSELPQHYRASDLYVSASHSDGSSVSLLEAMACGLPAIVSDIPGNREWVEPWKTGWRFPVGDAARLAETIREAVGARGEWPTLDRRARATTEERADWRRNFPLLFDAYRMAIDARGSDAHG